MYAAIVQQCRPYQDMFQGHVLLHVAAGNWLLAHLAYADITLTVNLMNSEINHRDVMFTRQKTKQKK